ncbi:AraC family transcriptional regulator [Acinetobacter sp. NIPH 2699]|uniref:AraC family transcriptional regulator n=1 Tax=Acinetobacter sp. NIPH 2699 TaxID=2923433 RepID=UPI001F4AEC7D|nr:AraC family transcriptional regulator [Acinetobacter sp. NIPH 2699]MCH7337220.1 AraC family transcriptional regulator [Acinetobacter sp. NIPH 2699]
MTYAWAFERSIHSVRLMADFAAELGVDYQVILKGTDLDQQHLLDPNMAVSAQQELQVIRNLVEQCGERTALGLDVGTRYHFTTFGSLGLALMSAANIRKALDFALAYFPLTFAFTQFIVSEEEQGIRIEFAVDKGIPQALSQFIVERDISALITVQRDLIPENFCLELAFSFQPKGDVQTYIDLFGIEPKFGETKNFIILDADNINQKLRMANELALQHAEQQCRQILEKRQSQKKYSHHVQQVLMHTKGEIPSMEIVADRLHLNTRTLRRHLLNEGTTFIKIREDVRKILADYYLSLPQTSIEQIAEWLGYAEATSFIHAYKRWYGKTPHASRLAMKILI